MTPAALALLIFSWVSGGQISPFTLTFDPIVEWEGGPYVYRFTLKNVSSSDVVVHYPRTLGHVSINSLDGPVPGFRDSVVFPRLTNDLDEYSKTQHELLTPGDSIVEVVPLHRNWKGRQLKFPANLSAAWHVSYSSERTDEAKKWCRAEMGCPFTARPKNPSPGTIDQFLKEMSRRVPQSFNGVANRADESIYWMENTRRLEFLPVLLRHLDAGDKYAAIQVMYSIVEIAKANPDTIPKLLLSPTSRSAFFLFVVWNDKLLSYPKPTKEMIAELSRAPNEWVRLLAWAAFPDQIREAPLALKKVHEMMNPKPTPSVIALAKQLDDPAFKVRETATKHLLEIDDIEPMLYHILAQPCTEEQQSRLKKIVESKSTRSSSAFDVACTLRTIDTPHGTKLVEMLATGPSHLRATLEATKILADLKEIKRRNKLSDEVDADIERDKKDKGPSRK